MNSLVHILLEVLNAQLRISHIRIVQLDETPAGQLEVKIRCRIDGQHQFQVWIHRGVADLDYAYQLFTTTPLLRWDNAPHYPKIATAPHHQHDEHNRVSASLLLGDPVVDLPIVLSEIERWLDASGAN